MRLLALLTLLLLPLFGGFFPNTVQTTVKSVSENQITMRHSFPVNGMSGVIVHRYKNGQKAITKAVVQTAKSTLQSLTNPIVLHENMPTIKTAVTPGDKVIGGYLYHNVLLLAPDTKTYSKITRQYHKHWIHPDLYATYLAKHGEDIPTKENLAAFARQYHVGLIYIVGSENSRLLDPISGKIVSNKRAETNLPEEPKFPFYSRFEKLSSGFFSTDTGDYYKTMDSIE
jgi:hypothetical protein